MVDPDLLERIVANLVANSLAHTPNDSLVEVDCRAAAAADSDGAVITITDHGPALEADSIDVGRSQHGTGHI
ncbi:MAG: ATP-binding protein [Candidatus Nanopelagicales bacterium]